MNFFGVGGLEFVVIFAVALFIVGPKRLAEGVRAGRKYYTEFKRYRDELTSLVNEAIDAEDLKKEFEETKKVVLDEKTIEEVKAAGQDLKIDQLDDMDIMTGRSIPRTSSRPRLLERGDGTVDGEKIPDIEIDTPPAEKRTAEGEAQ